MTTPLDPEVRERVVRQAALRSAWGVLAPSGLSAEKTDIAETGRALNEELKALASRGPASELAVELREIDARLDALEGEMRAVAFRVPVAQLRSTLPARVARDRRGVLALLDLMIGAEFEGQEGAEKRIPALDYLITLLCTAGAGRALHDPVTLTPRMNELCERCAVDYDPKLPEIEAEFFAAADMYEADAREELGLRVLRRRKTELGSRFFAPQVLRAIMTYNAALLQRIDGEVLDSQDWGELPPAAEEPTEDVSVFETSVLLEIAEALRRRVAGAPPELTPIDRIAWCLDLAYPNEPERRALLGTVGDRGDPIGTTVLVGLLCRSAVVLADEFPAIGISTEQLNARWIPELAELLQQEVNRRLASDEYQQACVFSELKNKFLYTSMADASRKNRDRAVSPAPAVSGEPLQAADENSAGEVLDREAGGADPAGWRGWKDWKRWPWSLLTRAAAASAVAVALAAVGWDVLGSVGLARFDRDQLDQVSPYLERGVRSEEGAGTGFVGVIRDGWSRLEPADQELVALDLVQALREQGVREVMIYDDEHRLRIQALGRQPARVVPIAGVGDSTRHAN